MRIVRQNWKFYCNTNIKHRALKENVVTDLVSQNIWKMLRRQKCDLPLLIIEIEGTVDSEEV